MAAGCCIARCRTTAPALTLHKHCAPSAPAPPLPRLQPGSSSGCGPSAAAEAGAGDGGFMADAAAQEAPAPRRKPPKIFYATRTHSQIAQARRRGGLVSGGGGGVLGGGGGAGAVVGPAAGCQRLQPAALIQYTPGNCMHPPPALPACPACLQVVKELKRCEYKPRMAVLVGACRRGCCRHRRCCCRCCLPVGSSYEPLGSWLASTGPVTPRHHPHHLPPYQQHTHSFTPSGLPQALLHQPARHAAGQHRRGVRGAAEGEPGGRRGLLWAQGTKVWGWCAGGSVGARPPPLPRN